MVNERIGRKLIFSRRLLLSLAVFVVVAVPVVFGQQQTQPQNKSAAATAPAYEYEVASIKLNKSDGFPYEVDAPDGFTATHISLGVLVIKAYLGPYMVSPDRVSGYPNWFFSDRYDVDARMDNSVADALKKLSPDERKLARQHMMEVLLADRCKLKVHRETKERPLSALLVAKNGPKFHEAKPGDTYASGVKGRDGIPVGPHFCGGMNDGKLILQAVPISCLVKVLWPNIGGPVIVDRTGLTGIYDITLLLNQEDLQESQQGGIGDVTGRALQQQLGLKLEPGKGPVEIIVIDHVEKPRRISIGQKLMAWKDSA